MNWTNLLPLLKRPALRVLAWLIMCSPLLLPGMALAAAPQPSLQRTPTPLLGFGLMFLMAVVVVAISFMPSKRSHLD